MFSRMPSYASSLNPHQSAHMLAQTLLAAEQIADLVGLDGVMERGDLEAELLAELNHRRHLVGAIAVVVDEDLAVEHSRPASPSAGFDPDAWRHRILRRATSSTCRDTPPPPARSGGTRRCCPSASPASGCVGRTHAADSRRRPSSSRPELRETSSPSAVRAGTFFTVTPRPPIRFPDPGRICIAVMPPASASSNWGSCGQIEWSAHTSAVIGIGHLIAILQRLDSWRRVHAKMRVRVDDARRHPLAGGIDHVSAGRAR